MIDRRLNCNPPGLAALGEPPARHHYESRHDGFRCARCGKFVADPIRTTFVYPPIPIRLFDWQAVRDGYDLGSPYGHGPTEEAAIADLLESEALRSDTEI
jgi:hypothetical protein